MGSTFSGSRLEGLPHSSQYQTTRSKWLFWYWNEVPCLVLPPSVLQFWYILMDTLMMVVSTSACHDQDNTFTPGSSVWNKGVDGGVGDGVLCLRRFCHHSHVVIRFKTCSIAINTKNIVKIMIKEWQLNLVHQLCVVGHASVLKPEKQPNQYSI